MAVVSRFVMACGHSICAARANVEEVFDLGSEKVKKSGWIMLQCASTAIMKALNMLTDFTWCPALDSERQTRSRQLSLNSRRNYVSSSTDQTRKRAPLPTVWNAMELNFY